MSEKVSFKYGVFVHSLCLTKTLSQWGWIVNAGLDCPAEIRGTRGCWTTDPMVALKSLCLFDDSAKLAMKHAMSWSWQRTLREGHSFVNPFPANIKPYDYQVIGANHMAARRRILLADQPGLGKTAQAIGACEINKNERVLVICPASLRKNWEREFGKFQTRLIAHQFEQYPGSGVAILNYDRLKKHEAELRAIQWDCVIFDECHYLKNKKSIRTIIALGDKYNSGIVPPKADLYFLSGTPMTKDPLDLWPIIHALDPLGNVWSYDSYTQEHMGYIKGRPPKNGSAKPQNLDILMIKLRLNFMLRRMKSDVLKELPPKIIRVIRIDQEKNKSKKSRLQKDLFDEENNALNISDKNLIIEAFRQEAIAEAESDAAIADNNTSAIVHTAEALRHVRSAMSDLPLAKERQEHGVSKIPLILERIKSFFDDNEKEKLVVFCAHRVVLQEIVKWSMEENLGPAWIDGTVKMDDRDPEVQRFQNDPTCKIFVGNIQAAGVGLTLTASHYVMLAEQSWIHVLNTQAMDRVDRIGQKETVIVEILVSDGIDLAVLRVCARKSELERMSLDGKIGQIVTPQDIAESRRFLKALESSGDPYSVRLFELLNGKEALNSEHVKLIKAAYNSVTI